MHESSLFISKPTLLLNGMTVGYVYNLYQFLTHSGLDIYIMKLMMERMLLTEETTIGLH